jgi:hypothetical protein
MPATKTEGTEPTGGTVPETVTLSVAAVAELQAASKQADELATQIAGFEAEKKEREAKSEAAGLDSDILALSTAGKLPPALHAWAKTQTREGLAAWAKDAPQYTPPAAAKQPQTESVMELSAVDADMCARMGIDPEAFKKTRAAEEKRAGKAAE